jgi:parallel beta-helix repeat protein
MQLWNSRRIRKEKQELKRKAVLAIMLTLLFIGILSLTFDIQQVEASGTITIKADGRVDPDTAPISTVDNVTYTFTANINDSIVVEKDDIVVDGAGYTLQGTGSGYGIELSYRSNVTIKNMEIKNFWAGIQLSFTSDNTISGNKITAFDYCGIYMDLYAPHNTISGNTITAPSKVERHGIFLGQTSGNNIISGNYIDGMYEYGIRGGASSNNIISGNTIKDTFNGIWFSGGSNNRIYHNNFINHPTDCHCPLNTTLDAGYPLGGNYWDDYNGADLFSGQYQNETGSDGIGDTAYTIDVNNQDNYPLMGMFSDFKATSEYRVQTICNSSISDFHFNGTAICFNVTGIDYTTGFCRICMPRALMNETYKVFVNGTEVQCNLLPCSNTTHSYLYFTYNHSTQEVIIIPEFPSFIILPLFMAATLLAVIIIRRKHRANLRVPV